MRGNGDVRSPRMGAEAQRLACNTCGNDEGVVIMPGGGDGQQTTVQNNEPWKPTIPYYLGDQARNIRGILPEVSAWYNSPAPQWYPGQSVATFAPEEEVGLQALAGRAMAGNPLMAAAGQHMQNAIGGQYLNNPYLGAMSDS